MSICDILRQYGNLTALDVNLNLYQFHVVGRHIETNILNIPTLHIKGDYISCVDLNTDQVSLNCRFFKDICVKNNGIINNPLCYTIINGSREKLPFVILTSFNPSKNSPLPLVHHVMLVDTLRESLALQVAEEPVTKQYVDILSAEQPTEQPTDNVDPLHQFLKGH